MDLVTIPSFFVSIGQRGIRFTSINILNGIESLLLIRYCDDGVFHICNLSHRSIIIGKRTSRANFKMQEKVVVIGAGVSGLSTAFLLLQKGYQVTIITQASIEKWNENDPFFASPKAGAFWDSVASPSKNHNQKYEAKAYRMLLNIAKTYGTESGIRLLPDYTYYKTKPASYQDPWFINHVDGFRYLEKKELPKDMGFGYVHIVPAINTSKYLGFLMTKIRQMGGTFKYDQISNLSNLYRNENVSTIFNCSGLGSIDLVGDKACFPIRGQLVVAKLEKSNCFKMNNDSIPESTGAYCIPRDDGTVCLGGVYSRGDWNMKTSSADTKGILERVSQLDPQLKSVIDAGKLQIKVETVGLRPARINGTRVEAEKISFPSLPRSNLLLVHNYGIFYSCV